MSSRGNGVLAGIVRAQQSELLGDWITAQDRGGRRDPLAEVENRRLSKGFLAALAECLDGADAENVAHASWGPVRDILDEMSSTRAVQGYSARDTATFVFSLKESLFTRLRQKLTEPEALAQALWSATLLIDRLGLHTAETFQKTRERVIERQQRELLELSTPVVELWQGILALPLIGSLDSSRTQVVMENLLERIVETRASIAIIDITGVPTVDTLVAQHLMKTVAAARLMGADCIISGIRPQIAQTIVHLGVDLSAVSTKASLGDAFRMALDRVGGVIAPAAAQVRTPGTASV
jgi:rsbT co-antagonist protein RsbR